jgi:hypothetical protein
MAGRGYAFWGYAKFLVTGMHASRSVTKKWRERICIPKKVLKPELGTQNFLPSEMTLGVLKCELHT